MNYKKQTTILLLFISLILSSCTDTCMSEKNNKNIITEKKRGKIFSDSGDSFVNSKYLYKGFVGLELAYDSILNAGNDIVTTINLEQQMFVEDALCEQLENFGADWGTVVLTEVKTGEIKAIANLKKTDDNEYIEMYNYAIASTIEPASLFKTFSLIAAMKDGYVKIDDIIEIIDKKDYNGFVVEDNNYEKQKMSVKEMFIKSSNIGIVEIIDKYYGENPDAFINKLKEIGIYKF